MNVQVHDRLSGGFTGIETYVVAVRMERIVEDSLDVVDELEDGGSLLGRRVEPGRDGPARDDERMAWAHRMDVENGERESVAGDPGGRRQFQERGRHGGQGAYLESEWMGKTPEARLLESALTVFPKLHRTPGRWPLGPLLAMIDDRR